VDRKAFYSRLDRAALIELLGVLFAALQHEYSRNEVLTIQLKRAKNG